jgi:UDP-3-O-[3-hydroxymyristoyl] glucosamine N-acyltransferase
MNLIFIGSNLSQETINLIGDINLVTTNKIKILGFLENKNHKYLKQTKKLLKYLGPALEWKKFKNSKFIFTYGKFMDRFLRDNLIKKLNIPKKRLANIIHPSVKIGKNVKIGYGNLIKENIIIRDNIVIDNHCVINPFSFIDSETIIKNNVFFSSFTQIGHRIKIEKNIFCGIRITILNNLKIAQGTRINAHSLCTQSIKKKNSVVFGTPAKILYFDNKK